MATSRTLPLSVVTIICAIAAYSTLVLRCYTRVRVVKHFGQDDWIMVGAGAFFTWLVIAIFRNPFYAVGTHTSDMSASDARLGYQLWWMDYIAYGVTMTLARLSIALFFLRITIWRWHHWLIYFNIFGNVTSGLCFIGIVAFQCTPVHYFWDKADLAAQGHCIPSHAFVGLGYLYGTVSAMCDLFFVALPVHLVWNLEVSKQTKLATASLLGVAGIGGCCPLIRMAYLHHFYDPDFFCKLHAAAAFGASLSYVATDATVDIAIWSIFEPGIVIAASSLATCRPLLGLLAVKLGLKKESTTNRRRKGIVKSLHSIVVGLAFDTPPPLPTRPSSQEHLNKLDIESRGDSAMAFRSETPSTMALRSETPSTIDDICICEATPVPIREIHVATSIQVEYTYDEKTQPVITEPPKSLSSVGTRSTRSPRPPLAPELNTYLGSVRDWFGSRVQMDRQPRPPGAPSYTSSNSNLTALPPMFRIPNQSYSGNSPMRSLAGSRMSGSTAPYTENARKIQA